MDSIILSIISIVISVLTLCIYLFQEYRKVFTLYWFAEYDVIFFPSDDKARQNPLEFVESYNHEFPAYHLEICTFKHSWVGNISKVYYGTDIFQYVGEDLNVIPAKSVYVAPSEHKYFGRVLITHQEKKNYKQRLKQVSKRI